MKKTIKEELNRQILKQTLINDNTLLEIESNKRNIIISVRFVEGLGIKEHVLTHMDVAVFTDHIDEIIQFNEDKSAIAIFQLVDGVLVLANVYDTLKHQFAISDFIDIVYRLKFPDKPLNKQLMKKMNTEVI